MEPQKTTSGRPVGGSSGSGLGGMVIRVAMLVGLLAIVVALMYYGMKYVNRLSTSPANTSAEKPAQVVNTTRTRAMLEAAKVGTDSAAASAATPMAAATGSAAATSSPAFSAVGSAVSAPAEAPPVVASSAKPVPSDLSTVPMGASKLPDFRNFVRDPQQMMDMLDDVRDETYGFDEPALYYFLNLARTSPADHYKPDPVDDPERPEVGYDQLLKVPTMYRGSAVTLSGLVGAVTEFRVPAANLVGIDKFWVIDMFKDRTSPQKASEGLSCTVVVTDDPGKLQKRTPIRVKAYFYKIRSYDLELVGGMYTYKCPMVIGKYVEVVPLTGTAAVGQVPEPTDSGPGAPWVVPVMGTVVFLGLVLLVGKRMMDRMNATRSSGRLKKDELTAEEIERRAKFLETYGPGGPPPTDDRRQ